jgi:hypothetical protein
MSRDISETGPAAPIQARSQGSANLQNIKDEHADQPTKNRATPHRNHVLPLLNRRRWKQLILKKNMMYMQGVCGVLQSVLCN